ncbi:hypothetical protein R5R35_011729 [Gryllus longicercus]|uniref:C2H2-type domain-containing protein n=1 Tax=Gryllus longicercus TaxID=2509291 RepID=A0AAN9YU82_9ORTH
MSSKGILPQTRNGSGQIEDVCKKELSDSLGFLKNGEYGLIAAESILPDSNQDVAEDCSNGENIASGVLEIASSANFILSSSEVTSDVVGVNVDDWFKHKSDGSMDLDTVLTADGIVNDLEAYHFASAKDNVDMCIVTNICDMGLGFDLPVNICDKCNHSIGECDCDERAVNEFDQTSFLDDFSKCDSEKGMLIKVNNPKLSEKCDLLSVKDKDITDSYILQFQDKDVKELKDGDWNQSDDVYGNTHPIVLNGDKVSWEALSSVSQHSTDYESEKEVDFPEFSLLTFQVENSEAINVVNTLPHIDSASDDCVPGNVIVSEDGALPETISLVEACSSEEQYVGTCTTQTVAASEESSVNIKTETQISENDIQTDILDIQADQPVVVETPQPSKTENKINNVSANKAATTTPTSSSHPRSLLRPSQKVSSSKANSGQTSLLENLPKSNNNSIPTRTPVRSEQENNGNQSGTKKAPAMTIIAISTDKSKNTTEIVINTSQGEQKFKGRTTDFIKATSKLMISQSVKAKIGQSLNLPNVESTKEDSSASPTENEEWLKYERNRAADEQPIMEALAALGIDTNAFTCVTTGGPNGFKLWACPIPDCNKLYPRLSLLKVHILTHYGVRPYRCDVPGCHWTFYTFFKLKRHKETHLKRKAFECPVPSCGHRFTTIYNLKAHRKLHERPAKLQCPVVGCDAHFQTKRAVEMHIKKHGISYAPYQCTYAGCGKRYYSSNTLNGHARSHQHREEEVHCQWPDCGKWFDKPCRLKAHMRIHTGDKPYLCTFQNCGWAFSSASKLKRHQQKHTNERKFRCSIEGCGKSFMRSEHLKEHTQTHIGERCYQCTVENCGVKFTAKSSLYVHLKKHKQQMKDAGIGSEGQSALQPPSSNASQCPPQKSKQKASDLLVSKWEQVENASDANHLDFVTSLLLSGGGNQQILVGTSEDQPVVTSDGLATVALQGPVCTVAVAGTGDMNSTGLLTTSSLFDPVTTYSSEFINSELLTAPQVGNMLVVTQQEAEEGEACLQDDTSAGTRVLLTSTTSTDATAPDQDRELNLATESISDPLLVDNYEQSRVIAFNLDNLSDSEVDEIADDPTCQAARTHLTYQDVIQRKRQQYTGSDNKVISSGCDNSVATIGSSNAGTCGTESALADAIVGLRDPVTALCIPPEMAGLVAPTTDLNLLLQEESGLQVLLLDGGDSQFYTESTINLRDLE